MFAFTSQAYAQELNDELKKRLRQSLIVPEQKPMQPQQHQPIQITPRQYLEVLKVSPTTKLPTKLDRFQVLYPPEEYKINLDLTVTNTSKSQVERAKTDYSNGKVNAVPDARSITQWTQYTRGDYGTGISLNVGDLDPVRAIQRHKARKRQGKVDKILRAYGQK